MKKILAILLAMSMLLALAVPVVAAEPTFTNVVFESWDGSTMKSGGATMEPYESLAEGQYYGSDHDSFPGITLDEIKAYIAQGGVYYSMYFYGTTYWGSNPPAPKAYFNLTGSDAASLNMDVIPLGNNMYVATIALDDISAIFTGTEIRNFAVEIWTGNFKLYRAWFTNEPNAWITTADVTVTWDATFVENSWNSDVTILEDTIVNGTKMNQGVNVWPAVLAAVNNDPTTITALTVSADISSGTWARQEDHGWNETNQSYDRPAGSETGPGADLVANSGAGKITDWGVKDGNSFSLSNGSTIGNYTVDFATLEDLQVQVFGGDPYVDEPATVTVTISIVKGSIPGLPAAAYVGTRKCLSVDEAITAALEGSYGKTISLAADFETDLLLIYPGLTLDLNGYTLTADKAVSFNTAHIVDNSEAKTGLLAVDEDSLSIGSANNAQMPLLTDNGYAFATMKMQQKASYDAENDALSITLKPSFGTAFNSTFADGMADKGVKVVIRVSWTDGNTTVNKDFRYNEDFVKTVYAANSGFSFTATGLGNYSDVTVTVMVISDLKVECAGESIVPTAIV